MEELEGYVNKIKEGWEKEKKQLAIEKENLEKLGADKLWSRQNPS